MFKIVKGIYHVPNLGRVDANKEVSNQMKLQLYLNKAFPFITINEKAIPFVKKQKLDGKVIASLINRAKTVEEVNILLSIKKDKILKNIAETRIAALTK